MTRRAALSVLFILAAIATAVWAGVWWSGLLSFLGWFFVLSSVGAAIRERELVLTEDCGCRS